MGSRSRLLWSDRGRNPTLRVGAPASPGGQVESGTTNPARETVSTDANARKLVVVYEGGSVTASKAALALIFNTNTLQWSRPGGLLPSGRRRKYGTRQRTNAAAGEAMTIRFNNGSQWTYRITGTHTDFIDNVISRLSANNIDEIWSERGTIYAKSFVDA